MAKKEPLPNGCSFSYFVFPKNWKTESAKVDLDWFIKYRFYEPGATVRQVKLKGMNDVKERKARRELTRQLLENEIKALKAGYNPNRKKFIREETSEISGDDTLSFALEYALAKIKVEKNTYPVIKSNMNGFLKGAKALGLTETPVNEIRRKHVIAILEKCEQLNPKFTNSTYNHYRSDMRILFKELVIREAIESNPIDEYLPKRQVEKKIRKILDREGRKPLHQLKDTNYTFWRFINILFHSSRRITELLAVTTEHVDLARQRFQILMKKGKKREWIWVTIENDALPFWQALISESHPGDYVFSEGLKPGKREKPLRAEQIKRRWAVHVQEKLGIDVGIYSLKHSHLEEIAAMKGITEAQKAAGHSTPVVTMIYAVGEADREHERRKEGAGTL